MILTPKQKAEELFVKYRNIIIDDVVDMKPAYFIMSDKMAKQSALYAVDDMQLVMSSVWDALGINENNRSSYLEEVKKEIEKL